MSLVKNESYITIQGWMVNDLKLTGNELLVYAVIYGFSQDGETKYTGSRQYLADWCGCSKPTIQAALNKLTERGLIIKDEIFSNGVKYCTYVANLTTSKEILLPGKKILPPQLKNLTTPSKEILPNNINNTINNNIDNNLSKDKKSPNKNTFKYSF